MAVATVTHTIEAAMAGVANRPAGFSRKLGVDLDARDATTRSDDVGQPRRVVVGSRHRPPTHDRPDSSSISAIIACCEDDDSGNPRFSLGHDRLIAVDRVKPTLS
jgi:hypothetical protein